MSSDKKVTPKSLKTNYFLNLLYEFFILLTPVITTPYISRVLGAEGVGIYSFTLAIAQYFVLVGNLGVKIYGQMEVAAVRERPEELSKIFFELAIVKLCATLLCLVVYLVFSSLNTLYQPERFILSVYVLASAFDISWFFRGIEDFSKIVFRNIGVKLIITVLIFVLVKQPSDVYLYVLLVSVSELVGNFMFIIPAARIIQKVSLSNLEIKRHIRPCLVFFIPTIATSVYTILDKAMLGYLTEGISENGYYEQAHKIEQILLVSITSLNMIMRSRMSYLFSQGKLKEMKNRLERSISFIMMIAVPMTFGLFAVAPVFIPLFLGSGFYKSIILLRIFSVLLIIIGLSNCLNTHYLGPSGKQGKNNYVLLMGAAVNIVLNLLLIPRIGAVGAALASVIAETLILAGYFYLSRDFFKVKRLFNLSWKYLGAGAMMFFTVSVFLMKSGEEDAIALIKSILLGAFVYGVCLILMKDKLIFESLSVISRNKK